MTSQEIGAFIRRERLKHRMTQPQFGRLCGLYYPDVCAIELGKRKVSPRYDTIDRMLDVLGYELVIRPKRDSE